ncbi:hypothetical protein SOVF_043560 [Spinacia oleracea]|uniref:Stemmadenine O-acetyltransferase-like n=1 Tax=Spinacia oleracea TaxID=3562 RepID=A0A9R0ILV0_SPIOL|nr:stemmadenine O-acetyltransferase-like [Spinacia oleracea]KNA21398.1 hypothetical protein SOVF_043560 [Spinacia oleracea]
MEQELEVDVKIISMETVKPSLPPPSNPKTHILSVLDQITPIFHFPLLLYYSAGVPNQHGGVDISGLKTSLSQTLDQFHPLAGRFLDESTISCNHQGIPFIETKVNSRLLDVMISPHKMKLLTKFLPCQEFKTRPISELTPLVFQINVFLCGGVVIGCYVLHKLLDAISLGTFFKYWSSLTNTRFNNLVKPDFEAIIKAFPPLPKEKHIVIPHDEVFKDTPPTQPNNLNTMSVIKSYVFDDVSLSKLKARATSELVPKPTRFEAVTGFIWEQILRNSGVEVEHTSLTMVVNIRQRVSPPLPRGSMGNLLRNARAQAHTSSGLQDLVKEIHLALSRTNQQITTTTSAEVIWSERKADYEAPLKHQQGYYCLSSWCKVGLDEVDFGFGKPVWIVPTDGRPPPIRNSICLTDYRHPQTGVEGIEAWVMLEQREIQCLQSNPVFLAFATPN